jgi:hypothetical protein
MPQASSQSAKRCRSGVKLALLHHPRWKVVPHRERRHAHSLKRDIDSAACNRAIDSPMSMTLPTTTLTLGQDAPVLQRSCAAPPSSLPQPHGNAPQSFFGAICGPRANYFANPSVNRTITSWLCHPVIDGYVVGPHKDNPIDSSTTIGYSPLSLNQGGNCDDKDCNNSSSSGLLRMRIRNE